MVLNKGEKNMTLDELNAILINQNRNVAIEKFRTCMNVITFIQTNWWLVRLQLMS